MLKFFFMAALSKNLSLLLYGSLRAVFSVKKRAVTYGKYEI
jgi:hypothetical protein